MFDVVGFIRELWFEVMGYETFLFLMHTLGLRDMHITKGRVSVLEIECLCHLNSSRVEGIFVYIRVCSFEVLVHLSSLFHIRSRESRGTKNGNLSPLRT